MSVVGKSLTWGTARVSRGGGGRGGRVGRLSTETIFSLHRLRERFGGGLGGGRESTHFGGNLAIPWRMGDGGTCAPCGMWGDPCGIHVRPVRLLCDICEGHGRRCEGTRWTDHAWEEDSSRTPCKCVKRIGISAALRTMKVARDARSYRPPTHRRISQGKAHAV